MALGISLGIVGGVLTGGVSAIGQRAFGSVVTGVGVTAGLEVIR